MDFPQAAFFLRNAGKIFPRILYNRIYGYNMSLALIKYIIVFFMVMIIFCIFAKPIVYDSRFTYLKFISNLKHPRSKVTKTKKLMRVKCA